MKQLFYTLIVTATEDFIPSMLDLNLQLALELKKSNKNSILINTSDVAQFYSYNDLKIVKVYFTSLPAFISLSGQVIFKSLVKMNIDFYIYAHGDFLKKALHLVKLEDILKKEKVLFIFPSKTYQLFTEQFFKDPKNSIFQFPFIDTNSFHYLKHKNKSNKLSFLYTGRIVDQKNICSAYYIAKKIAQKLEVDFNFIICGNIYSRPNSTVVDSSQQHSIAFPFKGKEIEYLPHIKSKQKLNQLYNSVDFYINLSTYHDESLGVAPIEALLTGCKSILSYWGGFIDLMKFELNNLNYINFLNSDYSFKIDEKLSFSNLNINFQKDHDRKKNAILFKRKMSEEIKNHRFFLRSPQRIFRFKGFSDQYKEIAISLIRRNQIIFRDPKQYQEIYSKLWK